MTTDELRSVFHVEHHSLVPEYHLVQLTHHLTRRHIPNAHTTNAHSPNSGKTLHEKTNTEKQWKVDNNPPSLLNDEMFVKAKQYIKDVDIIGELNNTVTVQFGASNSSEIDSASDLSDNEHEIELDDSDVHKIDLEVFGRQMKLVLKKQEGLLKKDGLKMWHALRNDSQPHGVDYEEMVSVSEIIAFMISFQNTILAFKKQT